jgi:hypothetical protein
MKSKLVLIMVQNAGGRVKGKLAPWALSPVTGGNGGAAGGW